MVIAVRCTAKFEVCFAISFKIAIDKNNRVAPITLAAHKFGVLATFNKLHRIGVLTIRRRN